MGLNAEKVRAYIESEEANEKTHFEADLHSRKGVQSIPFCIVNGQPMFSGTQPEGTFLRAFSEAPEI